MSDPTLEPEITFGPLSFRPLGIGTWQWGDGIVWGYQRNADDALRQAFDAALDSGLTLFDTAELYGFGRSETLIGQFRRIRDRNAVIATKFMPLPWRIRRADLIAALRRSLKRLALERVDLYQIHWPSPPLAVEAWAEALAQAVEAGLTRTVGVSNYSVDQMRRTHALLAKRGIQLASNQVEYSLVVRDPEQSGLVQACAELGVKLIAYSPLGMGILTGRYSAQNVPPGFRGRRFDTAYLTRAEPLIAKLRELGVANGKTPAQVALNWTLCKGAIPIPGARTPKQASDNAGALGWRLSTEAIAALDTISATLRA